MLKKLPIIIAVSLLAALIALPTTGVVQSPQKGGVLRIAATSLQQLDPYKTAAND